MRHQQQSEERCSSHCFCFYSESSGISIEGVRLLVRRLVASCLQRVLSIGVIEAGLESACLEIVYKYI